MSVSCTLLPCPERRSRRRHSRSSSTRRGSPRNPPPPPRMAPPPAAPQGGAWASDQAWKNRVSYILFLLKLQNYFGKAAYALMNPRHPSAELGSDERTVTTTVKKMAKDPRTPRSLLAIFREGEKGTKLEIFCLIIVKLIYFFCFEIRNGIKISLEGGRQ